MPSAVEQPSPARRGRPRRRSRGRDRGPSRLRRCAAAQGGFGAEDGRHERWVDSKRLRRDGDQPAPKMGARQRLPVVVQSLNTPAPRATSGPSPRPTALPGRRTAACVSQTAGACLENDMNSDARHELNLLEALTEDAHVTQRNLSAKLGMALGLTNIYLKRLVRKGYIKCVNVRPNRLSVPHHAERHRREDAPDLRVHGLFAPSLS